MVFGIALWLFYGVVTGDWPLIIADGFSLFLAATILLMKVRFGLRSCSYKDSYNPEIRKPVSRPSELFQRTGVVTARFTVHVGAVTPGEPPTKVHMTKVHIGVFSTQCHFAAKPDHTGSFFVMSRGNIL